MEKRKPGRPPREISREQAENPRKKRVPLGTIRSKLSAPTREGFHRCWINDYPAGHLQQALDAGYCFVDSTVPTGERGELANHDLDSMRKEQVGTKPDGSPMFAYLMEIKEEWHQEDMAEQLKRAQDIDEQIRSGEAGDRGNEFDTGQRYGGITYNT